MALEPNFILRIGSRGSPLALAQVELTKSALKKAHPELKTETIIVKTSGDWKPEDGERSLEELQTSEDSNSRWAGKGLFVKEIEQALIKGRIDCAIHSAKDVQTELLNGLSISHALPAEAANDVFIASSKADISQNINLLSNGYTIGTTSLRRQMQLLAANPALTVTPLRGNVQTRLDKVKAGQVDATILAKAGLNRLGITPEFCRDLSFTEMCPSGGQGIVAIETREADTDIRAIFDQISDNKTFMRLMAERSVLRQLNGSCHTPIGVHGELKDTGEMVLRMCLGHEDGSQIWSATETGDVSTPEQAEALGVRVASSLRDKIPPKALEQIL
jgi:hydroxymethylbilane synthase